MYRQARIRSLRSAVALVKQHIKVLLSNTIAGFLAGTKARTMSQQSSRKPTVIRYVEDNTERVCRLEAPVRCRTASSSHHRLPAVTGASGGRGGRRHDGGALGCRGAGEGRAQVGRPASGGAGSTGGRPGIAHVPDTLTEEISVTTRLQTVHPVYMALTTIPRAYKVWGHQLSQLTGCFCFSHTMYP